MTLGVTQEVRAAIAAARETKAVDFKARFDPQSLRDWCEITKDIVAMANSGGGLIIVGVNDDGGFPAQDASAVAQVDPATITDKILRYTGIQFSEVHLSAIRIWQHTVVAMRVGPAETPMVFTKPGCYDVGGGRQDRAFSQGQVYFRHGAKSEPGNSGDIRTWVNRELSRIRASWLGNIRKVVTAPQGSFVTVAPAAMADFAASELRPVRISDDPSATVYGRIDHNVTHPYRAMDVIPIVNKAIAPLCRITQHDVLCVRRVHAVESDPRFFWQPLFASPRYSPEFAQWLVARFQDDQAFFTKARDRYRQA